MCVQVCDCAAQNEPFRTHYFKYREDSPMVAPMSTETCTRFCASAA